MATAEVSNKVQETRHSNVGKALHNVLLPQLRSYINAKLEAFFQELVNEYNINDANSNTLANPKAKGYGFQYRVRKSKSDNWSVIQNHHDLGNLYINASFDKITDESCDLSSLLIIIIKEGKCFSPKQQSHANALAKIRNQWSHPNYADWTLDFYNSSFDIISKLLVEIETNTEVIKSLHNLKDLEDAHGLMGVTKLQVIGHGVYGKVWKAICTTLEPSNHYVLKSISLDINETNDNIINKEVNALQKLKHPGIIELHKSFISEKDHFKELNIIMELGDGNLQEHLSKGPMTFGDILDFVQQMVDVMEYLYKKKIIHRDIKPANILLKDGLYKLCDFGLVKDLSSTARGMDATSTKTLAGSIPYMAPQIKQFLLDGSRPRYSVKADAWSIGVVILECCISGDKKVNIVQEIQNLDKYKDNAIVDRVVRNLLVHEESGRMLLHDARIKEALSDLQKVS